MAGKGKEITGRQDTALLPIYVRGVAEELAISLETTYTEKRELRRDPTIALGRSFSVSPILISMWSVQCEDGIDEEIVRFIRKNILPWRLRYLTSALLGGIDFGWVPFEVVYAEEGGKIILDKLKPLLQDITTILIRADTGSFAGFIQDNEAVVDLDRALLVSFGVEGTMWYGTALLDNVVATQASWTDANDGAKRYDRKVAGSHFIIHYPPGSCLDSEGTEYTNAEMADVILESLESSGSVAVPQTVLEHIAELNAEQMAPYKWEIDILEDKGGRQGSFTARLKYLDTLKVRGLIMPERSMMEGSHGTLAEASAHIDLALTHMDYVHLYVTEILNLVVVNKLLELNWGKELVGRVWITPASLVDERRVYLQRVYLELLKELPKNESKAIDRDTLKDLVGVPKSDIVVPNEQGEEDGQEEDQGSEQDGNQDEGNEGNERDGSEEG